jgi:hypothetical protein
MANPTIEELKNEENYEQIARLNHGQIKEFVIDQLTGNGRIVRIYMFYQIFMVLVGIFFITRTVVLAFQHVLLPLYISIAALFFWVTLLIVIHELLHGIALKLTGAKKITFGGYLKKFIFYAEADRHVLNRRQFVFVALTPLIVVKVVTLAGIILFISQPLFYFFILTMSAHSLFCAGDIGLLSFFYKYPENEMYTFDVKEEKQSYYYQKKQ